MNGRREPPPLSFRGDRQDGHVYSIRQCAFDKLHLKRSQLDQFASLWTLRDCQRFEEPDCFGGGFHEKIARSIDEGKAMSEPKDFWDKAEIVGKVLVPIVVGVSVWLWNVERTKFQTTATMTQIAIGVLTGEPAESGSKALREWAIDVLRNPSSPPELSESAAAQLNSEGFPQPDFAVGLKELAESVQRYKDELSAAVPSNE
jgi:hypothetical protein